MAKSPVAVLAIILLVIGGEALLFGGDIAARSFPTFEEPTQSGLLGAIEGIVQIVSVIWGVVVFFFNLITFNVPDAPFFIRVPVGGILGSALIWSIASLIRGN